MATKTQLGTFSTEHSSSLTQPLLHAEVLHSDFCKCPTTRDSDSNTKNICVSPPPHSLRVQLKSVVARMSGKLVTDSVVV